MSSSPTKLPICLVGPTAVGKSEVAMLLAEQLGAEIISVDSMQVYRGIDIGTAKPTAAERARVPHHLIDIVDLTESFDAARFCAKAVEASGAIEGRGKRVIFCGGTGLYFRAFFDGLGSAPGSDPVIRAELETRPLAELLTELEARDPITFANIDRNNPRRVVRALEVIRVTGQPFSTQRATWGKPDSPPRARFFGMRRSVSDLQRRINLRVDAMFSKGLVAETERAITHGLQENRTALQAIGYRQVVDHLQGGISLADTIALVKVRTRQFAKRQITWFKNQPDIRWLDLQPADEFSFIARQIIDELRKS